MRRTQNNEWKINFRPFLFSSNEACCSLDRRHMPTFQLGNSVAGGGVRRNHWIITMIVVCVCLMDACYAWVTITLANMWNGRLGAGCRPRCVSANGKQWQNIQMKSARNMTAVVFIATELEVWPLHGCHQVNRTELLENRKQNSPIYSQHTRGVAFQMLWIGRYMDVI